MSLETTFASGVYANLVVSTKFAAGTAATEPADAAWTFAVASATDVSITVTSDIESIVKKNAVIVADAATDKQFVVTADVTLPAAVGTAVAVDSIEGDVGDGLPVAWAGTETYTYDHLHRVLGTENAPFTTSGQTQNLQSITYESAYTTSWEAAKQLTKNWNIARTGRFKPDDYAFMQLIDAGLNGGQLWAKIVYPGEDSFPAMSFEGAVIVNDWSAPAPSNGIVDATYTLLGQGQPKMVYIA